MKAFQDQPILNSFRDIKIEFVTFTPLSGLFELLYYYSASLVPGRNSDASDEVSPYCMDTHDGRLLQSSQNISFVPGEIPTPRKRFPYPRPTWSLMTNCYNLSLATSF